MPPLTLCSSIGAPPQDKKYGGEDKAALPLEGDHVYTARSTTFLHRDPRDFSPPAWLDRAASLVVGNGCDARAIIDTAQTPVRKVGEGRPNVVDRIIDGEVHFLINTTASKRTISDSYSIRRETLMKGVPYFTTLTGARAALGAMEAAHGGRPGVRSIQEYHAR